MRLSVTDLDGYAYYKEADWLTTADYVRRLKRLEPPTPAMKAGIDFHALLENWSLGKRATPVEAEYQFDFSRVSVELLKPDAVEVPVSREFLIGNDIITLAGRMDAIYGATGIDYKTAKRIEVENYMAAWQWRAYLALCPELQSFRYDVFQTKPGGEANEIVVTDYRRVDLNFYARLEDDLTEHIGAYVSFLKQLESAGWVELGARGVKRG